MLYIGIDVGGTNLKAGLVDETGNILAVERRPLDFRGPEQFAADVAQLAAAAAHKGGVAPEALEYVGMGLPGAVSGGDDADCAAVGEFFCGAGQGTRDFAVVTLGTGIGCGLLLGGKLHGGPASSEAGHLVICHGGELCNCGRRGCWERYASATALIQQTKAAMAAHPESLLHAIAAENGGVVEGRTAFQAAQAGDETALAVCGQYVEYLADGTISLINILRPEAVAIGGGVAAAPEHLLLEPLREIVARESFSSHGGITTRVLRAELGNDAGIIGAALLGRAI